jgi:hypothetical protein
VYLGQELQVTAPDVSNVITAESDPVGTIHIRLNGSAETALALPNSTAADPAWTPVPGTSPVLEVRADGHYPVGYIRIRQQ